MTSWAEADALKYPGRREPEAEARFTRDADAYEAGYRVGLRDAVPDREEPRALAEAARS